MKTARIEWAQIEVNVETGKFVVAAYDPSDFRYVLKEHDTREEAEASFIYYFHGIDQPEPTFPRWLHVWDLSSELLK